MYLEGKADNALDVVRYVREVDPTPDGRGRRAIDVRWLPWLRQCNVRYPQCAPIRYETRDPRC